MKSPDTSRRRWIARFLWAGIPLIAGWAIADHSLRGAGAMVFHAAVAEAGVRLRGERTDRLDALYATAKGAAPGTPANLEFLNAVLACHDVSSLRRLYHSLTSDRRDPGNNTAAIRLVQRRMVELDPDAALAFALTDQSPANTGWVDALCQGWAIGQSDERLTQFLRDFSTDLRHVQEKLKRTNLSWMEEMSGRIGALLGPERLLRLSIDSGFDAFDEPYISLFEAAARTAPDAAIVQFRRMTNPDLRRAALPALLLGLSRSNPERAIELTEQQDLPSDRGTRLEMVDRLAASGPGLLPDWIAGEPDLRSHPTALLILAASMARTGNPDGIAWADANLEGRMRRDFLTSLFQSQAYRNPSSAPATLAALPPAAQRAAIRSLRAAITENRLPNDAAPPPSEFWAALPGSPDPPAPPRQRPPLSWSEDPVASLRYSLQAGKLDSYAYPELAAQNWPASRDWPDQLPPLNADVARSLAEGYAQRDPAHAWEFATRQAVLDDTFRAGILRTWAETDPSAAAQIADHADPSVAELAEGAIVGQWAATDPAAAAAWAQSMPGRADRVASNLLPSLTDSNRAAARAFAATLTDSAAALAEIERRLARSQGQP